MKKKLFISLSTFAAISAPVAAVVSCGSTKVVAVPGQTGTQQQQGFQDSALPEKQWSEEGMQGTSMVDDNYAINFRSRENTKAVGWMSTFTPDASADMVDAYYNNAKIEGWRSADSWGAYMKYKYTFGLKNPNSTKFAGVSEEAPNWQGMGSDRTRPQSADPVEQSLYTNYWLGAYKEIYNKDAFDANAYDQNGDIAATGQLKRPWFGFNGAWKNFIFSEDHKEDAWQRLVFMKVLVPTKLASITGEASGATTRNGAFVDGKFMTIPELSALPADTNFYFIDKDMTGKDDNFVRDDWGWRAVVTDREFKESQATSDPVQKRSKLGVLSRVLTPAKQANLTNATLQGSIYHPSGWLNINVPANHGGDVVPYTGQYGDTRSTWYMPHKKRTGVNADPKIDTDWADHIAKTDGTNTGDEYFFDEEGYVKRVAVDASTGPIHSYNENPTYKIDARLSREDRFFSGRFSMVVGTQDLDSLIRTPIFLMPSQGAVPELNPALDGAYWLKPNTNSNAGSSNKVYEMSPGAIYDEGPNAAAIDAGTPGTKYYIHKMARKEIPHMAPGPNRFGGITKVHAVNGSTGGQPDFSWAWVENGRGGAKFYKGNAAPLASRMLRQTLHGERLLTEEGDTDPRNMVKFFGNYMRTFITRQVFAKSADYGASGKGY